ncbi:recombinase family protein [Sediminicola arcticus]|jgi:DNA invertase Pin-like site-specific DNA recombinase|uniref:Recombinase family protein n=1 Tax=Sediminicola arcticus TaxID=1574308 RepID=A0ABV2SSC1_9FLAO
MYATNNSRTLKYTRVSTTEQNDARQLNEDMPMLSDKCSGSIPFREREKGSIVLEMAQERNLDALHVQSIDRLGRNTLDIMQTIQELTDLGVNVVSEKEGLQTLINGKENPVSKLIINILATLSEFELNRIKERQAEGIAEAKKRGAYNTNGGKPAETIEQFLSKKGNAKCFKLLKTGTSVRTASKLAEISTGTSQKISKMIKDGLI